MKNSIKAWWSTVKVPLAWYAVCWLIAVAVYYSLSQMIGFDKQPAFYVGFGAGVVSYGYCWFSGRFKSVTGS